MHIYNLLLQNSLPIIKEVVFQHTLLNKGQSETLFLINNVTPLLALHYERCWTVCVWECEQTGVVPMPGRAQWMRLFSRAVLHIATGNQMPRSWPTRWHTWFLPFLYRRNLCLPFCMPLPLYIKTQTLSWWLFCWAHGLSLSETSHTRSQHTFNIMMSSGNTEDHFLQEPIGVCACWGVVIVVAALGRH